MIMGIWNSRGLRGSVLEDMINFSIEKYRENGLALIQKIPTPIKPVEISKTTRHITLAYFEKKSTVDYIGVVQGIPVCFDAKECNSDTFSMANIHEHQIRFMQEFEHQNGIAFIILYYSQRNELYYIPFADIADFYNRSISGERKSFRYDEINRNYRVSGKSGVPVHFLECLNLDLATREQ